MRDLVPFIPAVLAGWAAGALTWFAVGSQPIIVGLVAYLVTQVLLIVQMARS